MAAFCWTYYGSGDNELNKGLAACQRWLSDLAGRFFLLAEPRSEAAIEDECQNLPYF